MNILFFSCRLADWLTYRQRYSMRLISLLCMVGSAFAVCTNPKVKLRHFQRETLHFFLLGIFMLNICMHFYEVFCANFSEAENTFVLIHMLFVCLARWTLMNNQLHIPFFSLTIWWNKLFSEGSVNTKYLKRGLFKIETCGNCKVDDWDKEHSQWEHFLFWSGISEKLRI